MSLLVEINFFFSKILNRTFWGILCFLEEFITLRFYAIALVYHTFFPVLKHLMGANETMHWAKVPLSLVCLSTLHFLVFNVMSTIDEVCRLEGLRGCTRLEEFSGMKVSLLVIILNLPPLR